MEVINNTIIVPSGSSDWALRFSEDRGGHVIFNNILIKEGSGGGSICVGNTNFQSDYNVVGDRFSRNDESSTITLTSWRTSGQDVHSVSATSTALFQNASGSDYHLKAGAGAIDLGIAVFASANAPTSDQASAIRPQGSGYDAGAYEYGSGAAFSCDLTGDTVVNAIDLQRLVNDILQGSQSSNAYLSGTITDATGGVIVGVNVTATNAATGVVSTVVSNNAGVYAFRQPVARRIPNQRRKGRFSGSGSKTSGLQAPLRLGLISSWR